MNRKEFMEAVDKMAAEVVGQAYATAKELNSLSCERGQRRMKCVVGNGYIKIGFESAGGAVGCWWSSALSMKPHEKVLYEFKDGDNHDCVVAGLREYFWSMIHKANEFSSKRKLSGFAFPVMRDFSEYDVEISVASEELVDIDVSAGFRNDNLEVSDEPVGVVSDELAGFDGETLEDEVMRGLLESDGGETEAAAMVDDESGDVGEVSVKKRSLFGRGSKKEKHMKKGPDFAKGTYPDLDEKLDAVDRVDSVHAYETGMIDSGEEDGDE